MQAIYYINWMDGSRPEAIDTQTTITTTSRDHLKCQYRIASPAKQFIVSRLQCDQS